MKKIIFFLFALFSIGGYSQKTLEIYNYSATKSLSISIIITKPQTGIYPWFGSVTPSIITIPPGGQYVLQNNANLYRFPFYSPTSSPLITNWRKVVQSTGGNGSFTNVTSQVAWPLGTTQFFNNISFTVNNGLQGGNTVGEPIGSVTSSITNTTYNWAIDYVPSYVTSTLIFNTIVFYDI